MNARRRATSERVQRRWRKVLSHDRRGPVDDQLKHPQEDYAMFNKLAAGLIAAAVITAPVLGTFAATTPAAAATVAKTKTVKTKIVKAHRGHIRNYRVVQCFMTGSQARQVKQHAGPRFQRVACYLPNRVRIANLHGRTQARHAVKPAKVVKHVKVIKQVKTGHTG
jgi:hypothetical protein